MSSGHCFAQRTELITQVHAVPSEMHRQSSLSRLKAPVSHSASRPTELAKLLQWPARCKEQQKERYTCNAQD